MNARPQSVADAGLLARDLVYGEADFQRIRALIYRRAGIVLADNRRDMVYTRVGRRVRALGLMRFADYLARLDGDPGTPEWTAFTNALTTNQTSFFREPHHFPLLAAHVARTHDPLRVWSCAASTGQEAWSIAMQLAETLGGHDSFAVLATDIDTAALAVARDGVYPLAQVEKLDPKRLRRFFQKGRGGNHGHARVRPELADRVTFRTLNLVADHWPVSGPFDAIFCRNVMIYFDVETQARVLDRLAARMRPGGLLFAGHAENFTGITGRFRLRGQTVYARV